MARGRNAAVELQAEGAGAAAAEVPEEASNEQGGPGLSLFDASGDARIRILRRDDRTQKWIPHGYLPPDATEETVLRLYGGGTYWAQLLVQTDVGREGIKQQRKYTLQGMYKPPMNGVPGIDFSVDATGKRLPSPQSDAPAGASPALATMPMMGVGGGGDLMEVLKAGIINTLLDMMKASKETRTPAADPVMLEIMKAQAASSQQMMQLMMTIITPLLARDAGDSKKDILETLAKMKELVASPAATGNPMEMFNTMLETFTHMREVAEDISPPKRESGDPLMDSIPRLVEVVAEQHQMQKAQRAAVATRPVPGPAGGTAHMPVVGTIPPQQVESLAMWQRILRTHGERMVASAVAKHDADVLAGTAIIFATPAIREALAVFFHRDPAAVEVDILAEVPAMAEHREWLAEFIESAQARLFPDEFTDEDEGAVEDIPDGRAS